MAICSHQDDSPFYLWPDVGSSGLQAKKRVRSMVMHGTSVHTQTRVSLNQTGLLYIFHSGMGQFHTPSSTIIASVFSNSLLVGEE